MTLGDRLKEIRLVLQRPYVCWCYLQNDETIMLMLEGEGVPRLSFRGTGTQKGMIDAIEMAENYIKKEKKMGSLKPNKTDEKNEEKELEETANQEKEKEDKG